MVREENFILPEWIIERLYEEYVETMTSFLDDENSYLSVQLYGAKLCPYALIEGTNKVWRGGTISFRDVCKEMTGWVGPNMEVSEDNLEIIKQIESELMDALSFVENFQKQITVRGALSR